MTDQTPLWERPEPGRTRPNRNGVANEYLKTSGAGAGLSDDAQRAAVDAQRAFSDVMFKFGESIAGSRPRSNRAGSGRTGTDLESLFVSMFEMWMNGTETLLRMSEGFLDQRKDQMPSFDAFGQPDVSPDDSVMGRKKKQVRVAVDANRRAETAFGINQDVPVSLIAHALRPAQGGAPPIPVAVDQDETVATLKFRIPDDQPSGMYYGALIDGETDEKVGDISVRVFAQP